MGIHPQFDFVDLPIHSRCYVRKLAVKIEGFEKAQKGVTEFASQLQKFDNRLAQMQQLKEVHLFLTDRIETVIRRFKKTSPYIKVTMDCNEPVYC